MKSHNALLAGATGLVGGELLAQLAANDAYSRITVVTRRDLGARARSAKVRQVVVDFDDLGSVRDRLQAEHVFCALGTTIRKAGSQAKFRLVDYEYPLRIAQIARKNGARHFSIVSALGASRSSPFFYSRVKGELEESLRGMGWPSLCIVRPSLIAGDRGESRPMERLSALALRLAPATWRPVPAADIAAAMIKAALGSAPGVSVVESRNIPALARG